MMEYTAMVPNGESRRETAKYLTEVCEANGFDPHSIQTSRERDGFLVTEELADVLYDGADEDAEDEAKAKTAKAPAKKRSGNRAGKNQNSEEE